MIRIVYSLLFLFFIFFLHVGRVNAQNDSLVKLSELKYHSAFEEEAFNNYFKNGEGLFDLFLAIDEEMNSENAANAKKMYLSSMRGLKEKKIESRKINKKIKLSYSHFHSEFLKKYNDNGYFPVIFENGIYNCVTASMLYALVFDDLGIDYKVKASPGHVYLVANPGSNSIVIETTNPGFEKQIFSGQFKQDYVNSLRASKLISEQEYKNKSDEEIFEEKFNEVKDADSNNLPGFQYYNKALTKLEESNIDEALKLSRKAYFFYPDPKVEILYYTSLAYMIENCDYEKISDIDYLAQFSRFKNVDEKLITVIYNNVVNHHLQFTGRDEFLDSMNIRFISNLDDRELAADLDFVFNMQMAYRYQGTEKVGKYISRAMSIKEDHRNARHIMETYLRNKFYSIDDPDELLDTLKHIEEQYPYDFVPGLVSENKSRVYLRKAYLAFEDRKIAEGNVSLDEFEKTTEAPLKDFNLKGLAERAYRTAAIYYFYRGNKPRARSYVDRGLKYVPDSRVIQSAVY